MVKKIPASILSTPYIQAKRSEQELLSLSLVDFRNNYFTSEDPDEIIEFYRSFKSIEELVKWKKERPKGSYREFLKINLS